MKEEVCGARFPPGRAQATVFHRTPSSKGLCPLSFARRRAAWRPQEWQAQRLLDSAPGPRSEPAHSEQRLQQQGFLSSRKTLRLPLDIIFLEAVENDRLIGDTFCPERPRSDSLM